MADAVASSSKAAVRSLYRTFSRELRLGSVEPKPYLSRRRDPVPAYVRRLLRDPFQAAVTASHRRLDNLTALLQHSRIHGELLARYNPVYGKSEQERIKATANRVGLEVPKEFESGEDEMEQSIDAKYRS